MAIQENTEAEKDLEPEIEPVASSSVPSKTISWDIIKKNKSILPLSTLGAIAFLILGITIWNNLTNSPKTSENLTENIEQARLSVRSITVNLEPIQAWTYGDGYVRAITKKHLTFQAEGTIDYIKTIDGRDLREGDRVKKGELLARVDRRKYNADITVASVEQIEAKNKVQSTIADFKKAEQSLIQAEAELKQTEESLLQAQADLQKAKTDSSFAQAEFKRFQELYKEGATQKRNVEVEEKEYKNAIANENAASAKVRSATAQLAAARAKINSEKAQVIATKAQVRTAQAGVMSATAKLDKTNVESEDTDLIAPFDGVIARLNIRKGEYWTPQVLNLAGDYNSIIQRLPIIIIDPSRFEVEVELPAFQGGYVKPGQRAFILLEKDRSRANSGQITGQDLMKLARARGTVFSVSPSVSPGERSVRVTIRINTGFANIQDGEQVSTWIATQEKDKAIVAPFKAFVFRDRQPYVFVINEQEKIVQQKAIQPGIEGLAKREIITGIKPGDKLVTEGKNRLVNNAPIEIIP